MFYTIESPLEKDLRTKLSVRREKFLAKHPCLSEQELDSFMLEVLTASQHGVHPAIKNVSDIPNWGYGGSFFFAGALITTIGKASCRNYKFCNNCRNILYIINNRLQ